jgi:hypothetical protein
MSPARLQNALKIFLIVTLKATIFEKFKFTIGTGTGIYIVEMLSVASNYRRWGQAAYLRPQITKKLVCTFLFASPVGEQTGGEKYMRSYCHCGSR